jgi:hypothetical protein
MVRASHSLALLQWAALIGAASAYQRDSYPAKQTFWPPLNKDVVMGTTTVDVDACSFIFSDAVRLSAAHAVERATRNQLWSIAPAIARATQPCIMVDIASRAPQLSPSLPPSAIGFATNFHTQPKPTLKLNLHESLPPSPPPP